MNKPDTLETITKALLEELQVPYMFQLKLTTPTTLELKHPFISPHLYIAIRTDHITITEWERGNTTIPYANPLLVETIQQQINKCTTRKEAEEKGDYGQQP